MGGIGDNYQAETLDVLFGNNAGASLPATVYVALSTANPDFDGSGLNEPDTADGYGRVAVTNNSTNFPDASTVAGAARKHLATAVTFPTPTASWGGINWWAIMDSVTVGGGNVIAFGKFGGQSKSIATDDEVEIPSNTLHIYYREDI